MKYLLLFLLTSLSLKADLQIGIARDDFDSMDIQIDVFDFMVETKTNEIEKIYSFMSPQFRNVVPFSVFQRVLKDNKWNPQEIMISGTVTQYEHVAYFPIKGEILFGKKRHHIRTVMFLEKEGGIWFLRNFPFASYHIPHFGELPDFTVKGFNP